MIRAATRADLPRLLEMGRAFHAMSGAADLIPADDLSLTALFVKLIDEPSACLFVLDDGGAAGTIGGISYHHFANNGVKIAGEIFWWVDPYSRGGGARLMRAFEDWAQDIGADVICMAELEKGSAIGALYQRKGFVPMDHSWMRAV